MYENLWLNLVKEQSLTRMGLEKLSEILYINRVGVRYGCRTTRMIFDIKLEDIKLAPEYQINDLYY